MTQKFTFFLVLLLFTAGCKQTEQSPEQLQAQLKADIEYLASDELEGRYTGSAGEKLAANFIAERFEKLGLEKVDGNSWMHEFEFKRSNPHGVEIDSVDNIGRNVLGIIDNGSENTVIIGAHYDHLGHGASGSLDPESEAVHNGADDNASGVAGMLLIAEQLTHSESKANNYIFAAFSGEELGLFGSKALANSDLIKSKSVNYMLNFDMIGRLNEERTLVLNGTGTSPTWNSTLDEMTVDLNLSKHPSGFGPSDHTSFYLNDIPVLHLFTGQHSEYHKPSDDSELINYDGLNDVTTFVVDLVDNLDQKGKLEFTKTEDKQQETVSKFKVGLGIMPDYTFTGEGMRVDKVLSDQVGAKGGLKDKDVILKMGDHEIEDIYSYMDALGSFEKGQSIQIDVDRGGETKSLSVTFKKD